ncbi:hypothetical protein SH668x_003236 [Planctomicrobium sp. SH668]|uniref:hypothetical protein n=1 Tax=Planctomicrobium sp. SH668 TaxID=3448126 RepID=UPI003F5C475F
MRTFIAAGVASLVFSLFSSIAQAQHFSARHFDDLVFGASQAARELRWELHDHFADSRDRDHIIDDIQHLIVDLQELQNAIYAGRSPRMLDRNLDAAMESVSQLKGHLSGCDFATQRPAQYRGSAGGYQFAPATRHPGRVHVDHALQQLAAIETQLNEMHAELIVIINAPQIRPGTWAPGKTPGPQHSHHVKQPTFQVGNGKVTFQIGR